MTSEPELANTAISTKGERILREAFRQGVPIAALLGQVSGWSDRHKDPLVRLALKKASRTGENWKSLLFSNEEDAASVIQELVLAIDREWPPHEFDRMVETAATDIGLVGLDCVKYRDSRLKSWQELVGFFASREHAEAAIDAAISNELKQLFGNLKSQTVRLNR